MKKTMRLVLIGVLTLGTLGGCTERGEQRARDKWYDLTGQSEKTHRDAVDLNSASQRELARLPGLTDEDAARIVANRPYGNKRGLLRKKVIGEQKYEQIERYVYVDQPGRDD